MIGKAKIRCLFLLAWLAALSTKAQVSSENYILTTERISDTQVLSTTEYYDGLGRPFEMVEQKKTPDGDNLIHLQEYDESPLNRVYIGWHEKNGNQLNKVDDMVIGPYYRYP